MENEEQENINSQNDAEVTENTNEESVETTETEETGVDVEAEVKKATATLYARMKKAEEDAKAARAALANKTSETKPQTSSDEDIIAIINAKVNTDDVSEVKEYAKFKGISVAEALKTSVVKTLLAEKEEMRKTANATNTRGSRVNSTKVAPSDLLAKARAGEKVEDTDALALARLEERRAATKK